MIEVSAGQGAEDDLHSPFLVLIAAFFGGDESYASGWRVEPVVNSAQQWIHVWNTHATTPEQGWKLHISATVALAEEVLRRVLPPLMAERITFKVARSRGMLDALNQGWDGLSQIG
ncbi:MAG TPA: hypothetical protein VFS96_04485, partial [Nitrolancea sp.]|nr:hypothetical protein [Nitrolancea sp.]